MIVSLSDFKKFLKITDTNEDVALYMALVRSQAEAEKYCDRSFESSSYTEYYCTENGGTILQVDQFPIISVTSIHDDTDREWTSDDLISSDDYQLDSDAGRIILDGDFFTPSPHIKNVKIVYLAGYTEANMPQSIKLAIMKLAASDYQEAATHMNAVTQTQEGASKPDELRDEAYELLDLFKRWR